jgi:hypothetical protein
MKESYRVTLDRPPGVSQTELAEYIYVAVQGWAGGGDPASPLFGMFTNQRPEVALIRDLSTLTKMHYTGMAHLLSRLSKLIKDDETLALIEVACQDWAAHGALTPGWQVVRGHDRVDLVKRPV